VTTQAFGNVYDKRRPRDPLTRMVIRNFVHRVCGLIEGLPARSILDVGCGDGWLTAHLLKAQPRASLHVVDISPSLISLAGDLPSTVKRVVAAAEHLPFCAEAFDVVVASEVLEHLTQPSVSLREINRVTSRYALLTVPYEPFWSLGNLLVGRHLKTLGNTPGHLHRWGRRGFLRLLGSQFALVASRIALPWIVVLAVKTREPDR